LAEKLPDLTLPAGVGVNIHFTTGHERDLNLIAAAGFKFVRMDFVWEEIERKKGSYDWSNYDALTTELAQQGLQPYYILDFSNPLYEKSVAWTNPVTHKVEGPVTASPQHPESVAVYARWAAASAEHFRGRGVIWEIWNEPNISTFWKPHPDAAQYTTLALAAAKAMRAADPQACIVGPATSHFDWNFLEAFLKSGALEYFDAVSVHPYPDAPDGSPAAPETVAKDFARLRELIKQYAPAGKTIPILSGEWGYATVDGISLETQAGYIARMQLSNLLNGVPLSIWYDWKNDGTDPAYNEDNFGTVANDLTPKPAYLAIQTLTRELSGYRIARRHDTGNAEDFVLVLTNAAGATKLAAWTIGQPHNVMFDSKLKLELDAMPKYVSMGKARLPVFSVPGFAQH
jgi:hypothetical protein